MRPPKLYDDGVTACELEPGVDTKQAGDQCRRIKLGHESIYHRWNSVAVQEEFHSGMEYRRPVPAEPRAEVESTVAKSATVGVSPKPEASPCRACAAMREALEICTKSMHLASKLVDFRVQIAVADAALKLPCDCQREQGWDWKDKFDRAMERAQQLETDLAQARASAEDHCRRADTAEGAVATNCRRIAELEAEWGHEHNLAEAWREVFNLCYDLGMGDSDLSGLERVKQFIRTIPQSAWISSPREELWAKVYAASTSFMPENAANAAVAAFDAKFGEARKPSPASPPDAPPSAQEPR